MKFRRLSPILAACVLAVGLLTSARAGEMKYLGEHAPVAADILPAPPAVGSREANADYDEAYQVYASRTPEDFALGKSQVRPNLFLFTPAIGPDFRPGKYPRMEALFAEVTAETEAIVGAGKEQWKHPRPFVAEPRRFTDTLYREKSYGYPSGHSTRGTVYALILAELFPAQREAILAKGREIGWMRVTGGVHTPLDVFAGRVLGRALVRDFMASSAFQKDFDTVKREIAAAGR